MSNSNIHSDLFNQLVISAQPVSRRVIKEMKEHDIGSMHSGTVVTLSSGDKHLIHIGPEYSPLNDTVITSINNMSSQWIEIGSSYDPKCKVGDMMNNGSYKTESNNCHHVASNYSNSTVRVGSDNSHLEAK